VADGDDAGFLQLGAVLAEEIEDALETLLVIVDGLFQLMLFAIEFMLVVTVDRLADLLDQARGQAFAGFQIHQLILDRAGTGIDDKDGFRHCGLPPCCWYAVLRALRADAHLPRLILLGSGYKMLTKWPQSDYAIATHDAVRLLLRFNGRQSHGVDDILDQSAA
jgi:hypothetical protein